MTTSRRRSRPRGRRAIHDNREATAAIQDLSSWSAGLSPTSTTDGFTANDIRAIKTRTQALTNYFLRKDISNPETYEGFQDIPADAGINNLRLRNKALEGIQDNAVQLLKTLNPENYSNIPEDQIEILNRMYERAQRVIRWSREAEVQSYDTRRGIFVKSDSIPGYNPALTGAAQASRFGQILHQQNLKA